MSYEEPAFPHAVQCANGYIAPRKDGMTLRDYFAAKAMQALVMHHGVYDEDQASAACTTATEFGYCSDSVAKIAYTYADSMLAAREAK